MSITTESIQYNINGVISTDKTVLQNIEALANAAGCWFTFDVHTGKWSVVINNWRTTYEASFDDSNIIGSIKVSGTGINDLYNKVVVEFPHQDLNDEKDFVSIEIPNSNRNPNELDNTLNLQYDIVNNPIQAQALAFVELKQSRLDKVIEFSTDYSQINLKAGDVIRVTNTPLGFENKLFRIVTITEEDADEGQINLRITALEYLEEVYFFDDLVYYDRQTSTGIITIGSIGQPPAPQVTKFELASRPRFLVETVVPFGVVDGIEVWYYYLQGDELAQWDTALYPDEERVYTLYDTIRARPESGSATLETGQDVQLEIDDLSGGNYLFKVRAVNATTAGPYSATSGIVFYNPQQVTDQIGPNTGAIDAKGNALLGLLGANALLALLKGLMEDGDSEIGSIFRKIFDVFKDITGVDLIGSNTGGGFPVIYEGNTSVSATTQLTPLNTGSNLAFTITTANKGVYLFDSYFNFGYTAGQQAVDGNRAAVAYIKTGSVFGEGTVVATAGTSDRNTDVFNDLDTHIAVELDPGSYHVEFAYGTDSALNIRVTSVLMGPLVGQTVDITTYT